MTDLNSPGIRQASAADWRAVEALLVESGLPVADLDAGMLDSFLVAEAGPDIVGLIGLQRAGTIGLLRSLVVAKSARRLGLGGKLVTALELAATTAGVSELWLLTIDAENFFGRRGYRMMNRDVVPPTIRQSEEFNGLCPDTAFLLRKNLS